MPFFEVRVSIGEDVVRRYRVEAISAARAWQRHSRDEPESLDNQFKVNSRCELISVQ